MAFNLHEKELVGGSASVSVSALTGAVEPAAF